MCDLGVQHALLVGEVRRGPDLLAADDRRVLGVGQDFDVAPLRDLRSAPGVIVVEVCQDEPVDVARLQAELGQGGGELGA